MLFCTYIMILVGTGIRVGTGLVSICDQLMPSTNIFSLSCGSPLHFLIFLSSFLKNEPRIPYEENDLVRAINHTLQEHDCPYKLTEFVSHKESGSHGGYHDIVDAYPMVRLAQEPVIEAHAIEPVLELFANSAFASPNKDFREALRRHKAGDYKGAITSSAAAAEATLKVIAKKRGWRLKGTGVGELTRSFADKSGLPPKLHSIGKFIAERRQNAGDAHGKETVTKTAEAEARFMIALCASLIVFVASVY